MIIYTIGHSTRTIEEFIELLKIQKIKQLIDIRTIPKSRHNPQFNKDNLKKSLSGERINYRYFEILGGLRPAVKNSINEGWRNKSFRNYADYMQTKEFSEGIEKLIRFAKKKITVVMCAEAVPWRCHRSLVGDVLLTRLIKVQDIISPTNIKDHSLTPFAVVKGNQISYPPYEIEGHNAA